MPSDLASLIKEKLGKAALTPEEVLELYSPHAIIGKKKRLTWSLYRQIITILGPAIEKGQVDVKAYRKSLHLTGSSADIEFDTDELIITLPDKTQIRFSPTSFATPTTPVQIGVSGSNGNRVDLSYSDGWHMIIHGRKHAFDEKAFAEILKELTYE